MSRVDGDIEDLIEELDSLRNYQILSTSGRMFVGINVTIGKRRIPVTFLLRYTYKQNKLAGADFDIEYPLDVLIRQEDLDIRDDILLMFRVFGKELDTAVHHRAYRKFINEIYYPWYTTGLK